MRNSFLRKELKGTKRDSVASFWGPALLGGSSGCGVLQKVARRPDPILGCCSLHSSCYWKWSWSRREVEPADGASWMKEVGTNSGGPRSFSLVAWTAWHPEKVYEGGNGWRRGSG